jgi:hypothetical protein
MIEHVQGVPAVAIFGLHHIESAPAFEAQTAVLLAQPNPRILFDMQSMKNISSIFRDRETALNGVQA